MSCQNLQGSVHVRHDLIRDSIFAQCLTLDAASVLTRDQSQHLNVATTLHSDFEHPLTEQRATDSTVPGDIVVQLSRDSPTKTFYDVTVVNCLTERAVEEINKKSDYEFGIESLLEESFQKKKYKHESDVARAGGRFVPLVLSSTGVWHGVSS